MKSNCYNVVILCNRRLVHKCPCGTLSRLLMINFREFIRFTKSLLLPHKYIGLSHPTLAPGPKRPTVSNLCQELAYWRSAPAVASGIYFTGCVVGESSLSRKGFWSALFCQERMVRVGLHLHNHSKHTQRLGYITAPSWSEHPSFPGVTNELWNRV